MAIGLGALLFAARLMALRVQDRLIRLEESLRLARLLPADLQGAEASARLLDQLKQEQQKLAAEHGRHVPLLFKVAPDLDEEQIKARALASEKVIELLAGKAPKKVIVIKGRMVSIVV